MGVACIPIEFVKNELDSGKLVEIKTEPQLPARAIGIAVKKDGNRVKEVDEFLKLINEK
jgi:DNA-binding transcriptional LysR family regulator